METKTKTLADMPEILDEAKKKVETKKEVIEELEGVSPELAEKFGLVVADKEGVPDEWLVDESLLLKGAVNLLAADGGTGKTTFAGFLASLVIKETGKRVLYWSFEDDSKAVAQKIGINKKLVLMNPKELPRISTEKGYEEIGKLIKQLDTPLLIVDPISAVIGDINKAHEVQSVLNGFRNLAADTGCTILGIHHVKKYEDNGPLVSCVTGTRAWTNTPRNVLVMAKTKAHGVCIEVAKKNHSGLFGKTWQIVGEKDSKTGYWRDTELQAFDAIGIITNDRAISSGSKNEDDLSDPVFTKLQSLFGDQPFTRDDLEAKSDNNEDLYQKFFRWKKRECNSSKFRELDPGESKHNNKGRPMKTWQLNERWYFDEDSEDGEIPFTEEEAQSRLPIDDMVEEENDFER